jgi:hypothetical protein
MEKQVAITLFHNIHPNFFEREYIRNLEEDEIFQKWNLLTANSDKLPEGYTSVINKDAVLNSYEIKEQVLVMDVSPEIKLSNGRSAIETIAWTFLNDGIEEVVAVDSNR